MTALGGSKIRNRRSSIFGTFGCLVHRPNEPGAVFILSASHVLAMNGLALPSDPILWNDNGQERPIGVFDSFVRFSPSGSGQLCDAAIARVTEPDLVSPDIDGIGELGANISRALFIGKSLALHGAKSGVLRGLTLYRPDQAVPVTYPGTNGAAPYTVQFAGQIFYGRPAGDSVQVATLGGDSGALVVDAQNQAVGLHICRTPTDSAVSASVCTPIAEVLAALQVELVTGANWPQISAGLRRLPPSAPAVAPPPPAAPVTTTSATTDPVTQPGTLAALQDSVSAATIATLGIATGGLVLPHHFADSVTWSLSPEGLIVEDALNFSAGRLVTVPRVWQTFGQQIVRQCTVLGVPVELAIATICTETGGDPSAIRTEPGWLSDTATPNRVSAGLMQTLISTAREALSDATISRDQLLRPEESLRAGLTFIKMQRASTGYDPPKVAAAYNAGSLRLNSSSTNRWKMAQFPMGTSQHVDQFVMWFNDCFRFFDSMQDRTQIPDCSFYRLLRTA